MSIQRSRKFAATQSPTNDRSFQTSSSTQSSVSRLLTPEEVATLLGTTRLFVIRASRAGRIPAIKLGKVYRYRPNTIASWLNEQEGLQPEAEGAV
jgi:excisionase family DNA binding protein